MSDGKDGIAYHELIPILIKAVQDIEDKYTSIVEELRNEIELLKAA